MDKIYGDAQFGQPVTGPRCLIYKYMQDAYLDDGLPFTRRPCHSSEGNLSDLQIWMGFQPIYGLDCMS